MTTTEASSVELSDYEKERGKPMPSFNHALVQARLCAAFFTAKQYTVLPELTLELPDGQRLTPDVCVYPETSANWLHDTIRMKTMPLLVVEIPSPMQGFQAVADKLPFYFAHGVKSVWVVQPGLQAVAIYLPGIDRPQVFTSGEVKDPAVGVTARLEEIFA